MSISLKSLPFNDDGILSVNGLNPLSSKLLPSSIFVVLFEKSASLNPLIKVLSKFV